MQKNDRVFVDGMSSVVLMDGVIRMAFFNNRGTARDPEQEPCGELVMSQQAFFRAFNAMEDLMRQLIEAGIVKRNTDDDGEAETADSVGVASDASPNFQ